ncbi:zinc ABC transporter ATP-binding protein [Candidatus Saccharibacteria bacterium HGW-Saccharibacteria-1]|jgi:zinc transport system ATP-binding protein|nr:MAG: zinc ABC transporter ATP-binding protein [Candidatus Saccharibacteria bacterium HGW-Saccharibacteria-1]
MLKSNKETYKISKQPLNANNTIFRVSNLCVDFNNYKVLDDLSLEVKNGEFIGLIGPNGAGKSTLLKSMLGLTSISSGIVENNIKNSIGYVPQRGFMQNQQVPISVIEIIGLATSDKTKALDALRDVDAIDLKNRKFNELSGGQQQRILIAKSLASDSKLLILDEPTTGIDEKSQDIFFEILKCLTKRGIAIIIVSHDVDVVLNLVNRVIHLNQKILYDGPPNEFKLERYLTKHDNKKRILLRHEHEEGHKC